MSIRLASTAFSAGAPIPKEYTGEGKDVSPPLSWSGLPKQTQELALICDDPDAPTDEPWVHWVAYGISPAADGLPEGIPPQQNVTAHGGLKQGRNSWPSGQTIGYRGPMPPPRHGTHHYHFRLYALDQKLNAAAGLDKPSLLAAMDGHILATGKLIGTYER